MTTTASEFTVSLPIADRQRAADFYREAFGFEPVGTPTEDGLPEPLQYRLAGRTLLALIPSDGLDWVLGSRQLAPVAVSECLLGLTLDTAHNVDALVDRVRHTGGEVITAPEQQEWGYTAICADPDGHAWQITAEREGPL
ncbi:VOC family protein [Polymorphospora rubra]|uniref:Glyoxalase n=1 Tax=Polymorphospora rubra TaxID=338584 RepID=A0A810N2U0_9ACTN|nr:VOC family protein [Polymorphospora rubra]BCJ67981.1 glyoxalase [Polymorphospora rubra]